MRGAIRKHFHAIAIAAVLTAILSYPTIAYLFRFDVFWLPEAGNRDVLTNLWNSWYFGQILAGKADLFFSDLIFYPDGVSLVYSYVSIPYSLSMNFFQIFMPPSNAFCFTFLLILFTNALAAYVYLYWLFQDKWLAVFGAVVFGFCPQSLGYTAWPAINWIAPMPIAFYLFHRGVSEGRWKLVALAGVCAGFTCVVVLYLYVCVVIALGLLACALAWKRWRDRQFWRLLAILILAITLASGWRVLPMLQDREQIGRAAEIALDEPNLQDVMSFFINEQNPFLGFPLTSLLQIPENKAIGGKSFLGYLPLALVAIGLLSASSRRKMLPWLGLLAVFLALRLESTLVINGTVFEGVKLPKHYLNQLLPFVFSAFTRAKFFMAGAWLPWAVLACFGLLALRRRLPILTRPAAILAMIAFVCLEYYIPVDRPTLPWGPEVTPQRTAFLNWLGDQPEEVGLVNLPLSSNHVKVYSYYQSLSGFPISEGAISRQPDGAWDYIRGNYLLNRWHSYRPMHCETADREAYLAALADIEAVGFSHIVYHRDLYNAAHIAESFQGVQASYSDAYVSIYTPADLRASCPAEDGARHIFAAVHADALSLSEHLDERHGMTVALSPTAEIGEHFMRHLRHNGYAGKSIAAISNGADGQVAWHNADADQIESLNAIWLIKDRHDFAPDRDDANYAWLLQRFQYCARHFQDEHTVIDLYLKRDIPCQAVDESSAINARYEDDILLNNAYMELDGQALRVHLAWTIGAKDAYSFSLQFFAEDGRKALQFDHLIRGELLSDYTLDAAPLGEGKYSVQMIVYDYETRVSQSGTLVETGAAFERALELSRIEISQSTA